MSEDAELVALIEQRVSRMRPEWWKSSSEETFAGLAVDLVDHGYSVDEAIQLLNIAFGAVAAEYGE